jgi:hypothetical protein
MVVAAARSVRGPLITTRDGEIRVEILPGGPLARVGSSFIQVMTVIFVREVW